MNTFKIRTVDANKIEITFNGNLLELKKDMYEYPNEYLNNIHYHLLLVGNKNEGFPFYEKNFK